MLKKFHFYRFEFKYLVSEKYQSFIREDLLPFMQWDSYARKKRDKKYLVNSLYFDSYDFKSFWEKIAGIKDRFKLRLRTYRLNKFSDREEIFFEIKRKRNATIIKDRGLFKYSDCQLLLKTQDINTLLKSKKVKKRNILKDFLRLKTKFRMTPKIKVVYEREPFEGIYYQNLRITFDSNLQACLANNFSSTNCYRKLLKNHFVLEVKYRGILPYWFHQIIQRYELQRISFSKYAQAIELMI